MAAAYPFDRIDRHILMNLQAEGRLTNQALAERVALSPSACLARVRRLEEMGVIQGYHARLDPLKLGPALILFAEVALRAHGSADLQRFEGGIQTYPQIVEASHVSGDYDYLLKVIVADMAEWNRIAQQLTDAEIGAARVNTHILLDKSKVFVGYPIEVG